MTYVIPAVGLTLGALFLGEPVDVRLLTGAAMIVGSIGMCSATRLNKTTAAVTDPQP